MADYDTTVGIQLTDDFSKAIARAKRLTDAISGLEKSLRKTTSQIKNLENMSNSLKKVGNINFNNVNELSKSISKLESKMKKINSSSLEGVAKSFNSIMSKSSMFDISGIDKLKEIPKVMKSIEKLDSKRMGKTFSTLATQIQPFIAKLKEAHVEINNLGTVINSLNKFNKKFGNAFNTRSGLNESLNGSKEKVKDLGNEGTKTKNKLNGMFTTGNMIYLFNMSKRLFSGIGNILNKSIDFNEIENYFSRAMGNMRGEAMKFQTKMSEMFGMAMPDMMKMQTTFKNMLGSLGGLSDQLSYGLSETITKMALDFSSLYNVSIESAATKFQAALSKQVRPIRSVSGYDITQNVLGSTLQNIGIHDRSISQMNEIEKRLTIILTLQQQMGRSNAMNDFSRTIEQPANQLRILQQQLSEVGRWMSAVFMGTIGKIFPYINGFVMAIKEVIKTFALFVGYEIPDSSNATGTILDGMESGAEDFGDALGSGVDNANEGLDKAKKTVDSLLAPFDKLNILQKPNEETPTGGTGGGGGTGGLGGMNIDPRILDALNKYKYIFDDIDMKANRIKNEMLEWMSIAGNMVKENIFEPIKRSWDTYGDSTLREFYNGFENINELIKSHNEIWSRQFKPFFQSASDLFFSLLETAGIVFDGVTGFLLDVWNFGGKVLYEQLIRLVSSILKLGTSINDNFIKPVLKGFKDYLLPVISATIGLALKIFGNLIGVLADVITELSKCKTFVFVLGTAFTSMFLTIKIAKFIELTSSMKGSHKVLKAFTQILYDHSSIFRKVYDSWSNGNTAVGSLKSTLKTANDVLKNSTLFTKLHDTALKLTTKSVDMQTNSTGLFATAQGIGAKATGLFAKALTFLSANPLVLVGIAIAGAIGAIALFSSTQDKARYSMDDYSQSIQDNIKKLDDLEEGMKSASESAKNTLVENEANIKITERYIDTLKSMSGENGYVKDIEQAKFYIEKVNSIMPETVRLTAEGRLEWQKTPAEIQKVIASLKEKAKMDAYEQLYVASLKASISATQDQAEAIDKSNNAKKRLLIIEKEMSERNYENQKEYTQLKADIDGYGKEIDKCSDVIDKSAKQIGGYEKELAGLGNTTNSASMSFKDLSSSQNKAFNDLKTGLEVSLSALQSHSNGTKLLNDTELQNTKDAVNGQIEQYASKAVSYGLSCDDMFAIMQQQGIKLSEEEKLQAENSYTNLTNKNIQELAEFNKQKEEIFKVIEEENGSISASKKSSYETLLKDLDGYGIEVNKRNTKLYSTILEACQESGINIKTEDGSKFAFLLSKLDEYGVNVNAKDYKRYSQMLTDAQRNKIDLTDIKGKQYIELLALLDRHNIDYNSKESAQYRKDFISKKETGQDSGQAFIDELARAMGDSSGKVKNQGYRVAKDTQSEIESVKPKINVYAEANQYSIDRVKNTIADNIGNMSANINVGSNGQISFDVSRIRGWATGGFPAVGELFMARENGPELVGNIGGRTGVANNDQIISGIREASYQGMSRALREVRTSNKSDGTTVIEVYLGNELIETQIVKANEKHIRKTGKPVFSR